MSQRQLHNGGTKKIPRQSIVKVCLYFEGKLQIFSDETELCMCVICQYVFWLLKYDGWQARVDQLTDACKIV